MVDANAGLVKDLLQFQENQRKMQAVVILNIVILFWLLCVH